MHFLKFFQTWLETDFVQRTSSYGLWSLIDALATLHYPILATLTGTRAWMVDRLYLRVLQTAGARADRGDVQRYVWLTEFVYSGTEALHEHIDGSTARGAFFERIRSWALSSAISCHEPSAQGNTTVCNAYPAVPHWGHFSCHGKISLNKFYFIT